MPRQRVNDAPLKRNRLIPSPRDLIISERCVLLLQRIRQFWPDRVALDQSQIFTWLEERAQYGNSTFCIENNRSVQPSSRHHWRSVLPRHCQLPRSLFTDRWSVNAAIPALKEHPHRGCSWPIRLALLLDAGPSGSCTPPYTRNSWPSAPHPQMAPACLLTRAWRPSATPQPDQNREPGDLDQLQDGQPLRLDLQLRDGLLIPAEAGGKLSLSKLCPLPALQQQLPEFIMLRRPTFLAFHRGADLETPVEQRLRLRPTCPRTKCPQGREGELHETARN
jgi:hypothetical protein